MDTKLLTYFLSGSVIGSVVTFTVTEIIWFFKERIRQKAELNRLVFEKKIICAERATAYYYTALTSTTEFKDQFKAFEKAVTEKFETKIDLETLSTLMDTTGKRILELQKCDFLDVHAIHLYFDLEGLVGTDNQAGNEAVLKLHYLNKELLSASNGLRKYTEMGIQTDVEHFTDEQERLLGEYAAGLKDVITLLERSIELMKTILSNIKLNLRK